MGVVYCTQLRVHTTVYIMSYIDALFLDTSICINQRTMHIIIITISFHHSPFLPSLSHPLTPSPLSLTLPLPISLSLSLKTHHCSATNKHVSPNVALTLMKLRTVPNWEVGVVLI